MSSHAHVRSFDAPGIYLILVQGALREGAPFLDDLSIAAQYSEQGSPVTLLSGTLTDQAALMGVLTALYDRGITVLAVNRVASA